jgi:hypothetical protein
MPAPKNLFFGRRVHPIISKLDFNHSVHSLTSTLPLYIDEPLTAIIHTNRLQYIACECHLFLPLICLTFMDACNVLVECALTAFLPLIKLSLVLHITRTSNHFWRTETQPTNFHIPIFFVVFDPRTFAMKPSISHSFFHSHGNLPYVRGPPPNRGMELCTI